MKKTFHIIKSGWMYIFLGIVLLATMSGLIIYQMFRQDPVTVTFKNAQGYTTTQVVFKHPNDSVGDVVRKASNQSDKFSCDLDLNDKINTTESLKLVEKVNGVINVDGTVVPFESGAATIGDVLVENNITVSPADTIIPDKNEELTALNNNITIERGTNQVQTVTEVLPFVIELRENNNAPYNKQSIIQEGKNGVRTYTEETIYQKGQLVDSYITSEEKINPVTEIIEVGTNLEVGKPDIEPGDVESWRPYVIKALEKNGLSTDESMVNKVLRQIVTESDGDQNAQQEIIDMNTHMGQEAMGLMQTIPSTFDYYHLDGYDDILNGYHNLLAALNYAKERYGPSLRGLGEGHGY